MLESATVRAVEGDKEKRSCVMAAELSSNFCAVVADECKGNPRSQLWLRRSGNKCRRYASRTGGTDNASHTPSSERGSRSARAPIRLGDRIFLTRPRCTLSISPLLVLCFVREE